MVLITKEGEEKVESFTTLTRLMHFYRKKGIAQGSYYYILKKLRAAPHGEWAKYKQYKLMRI